MSTHNVYFLSKIEAVNDYLCKTLFSLYRVEFARVLWAQTCLRDVSNGVSVFWVFFFFYRHTAYMWYTTHRDQLHTCMSLPLQYF